MASVNNFQRAKNCSLRREKFTTMSYDFFTGKIPVRT